MVWRFQNVSTHAKLYCQGCVRKRVCAPLTLSPYPSHSSCSTNCDSSLIPSSLYPHPYPDITTSPFFLATDSNSKNRSLAVRNAYLLVEIVNFWAAPRDASLVRQDCHHTRNIYNTVFNRTCYHIIVNTCPHHLAAGLQHSEVQQDWRHHHPYFQHARRRLSGVLRGGVGDVCAYGGVRQRFSVRGALRQKDLSVQPVGTLGRSFVCFFLSLW